jgi:citronellol/citronellal dehydrogenase
LAIWSAARHDRLQHALPFIGAVNIARGIAVNALWPRTTIATSAIKKFRGDAVMRASRTPDILADAAHAIFLKDAKTFTGNFLIDDTFLFSNGVRDFDRYRVDPGVDLEPDFFVCQTTRHRRSA